MTRPHEVGKPADPPARYEIRVQGVLDPGWSAWLDGLRVNSDGHGVTTIAGPLVDQPALHGLLAKVRDLGLPLLSSPPDRPRPLTNPEAAMRPFRTPRRQSRIPTRRQLRTPARPRGRRAGRLVDRRSPSGRLLPY
jgi:hypothetical protein